MDYLSTPHAPPVARTDQGDRDAFTCGRTDKLEGADGCAGVIEYLPVRIALESC